MGDRRCTLTLVLWLMSSVVLLVGVTVLMRPPRSAPDWPRKLSRLGVKDPRVLSSMRRVRRGDFLPWDVARHELDDRPLPIGFEQTTSQPSLIAEMLDALEVEPGDRVLEVGTGCGYQTALLAELGLDVFSVDVVEPLATRAARRLAARGYRAKVRVGDGYLGWPEAAPFAAIVVCASAPRVPAPLLEQLAVGGRLVIPVEDSLERHTKRAGGVVEVERLLPVTFVPLTGPFAARDRAQQFPAAPDGPVPPR